MAELKKPTPPPTQMIREGVNPKIPKPKTFFSALVIAYYKLFLSLF